MPITAIQRDAPTLDRLVTLTLERTGRHNNFGEYVRGEAGTMKVWAARMEFDVAITVVSQGKSLEAQAFCSD